MIIEIEKLTVLKYLENLLSTSLEENIAETLARD